MTPRKRRPIRRRIPERPLQKLWKHLARTEPIEEMAGRKPTAMPTAIIVHGMRFIQTFHMLPIANNEFFLRLIPSAHESPIAVGLFARGGAPLGIVQIGFARKTIVIERFKGYNVKPLNDRLIALTGKPWPHLAIKRIEDHARKEGYTHSLFRRAETLESYQNPITGFEDSARHDMKIEETRAEMRRIYGITAKGLGYKKKNREFKEKKL